MVNSKNTKKKLPPLPAGKRRKYTEQQRIEILLLLRENSYNYRKTEFDTGVPYATIKVWYSKYKNELSQMTSVSCIAEKVEMNIARIKTGFIQDHYTKMNDLASEAIKRAGELIKGETDLQKVNSTLKVITEYFSRLTEVDPGGSKSGDTINIIRQTINNMNEGKE